MVRRPTRTGAGRWKAAALAAVLGAALAGPVAGAEPEAVGRVEEVQLPAEIAPAGGLWRPLDPGSPIRTGDRIRTGPGGRVRVAFHDGSALYLAENSEMAVVRYPAGRASGPRTAEIRLFRGRLEGSAATAYASPGNDFRIVSPTATVRVLGAEFVLGYDTEQEATTVTGLRGRLAVHSALDPAGRGVVLTARQSTSVRRAAPPDPAREVDPNLLEQMSGESFRSLWPDEVTWRASGILRPDVAGAEDRFATAGAAAEAPEVGSRRGSSVAQGNDVGEVLGESPAALGAPGGLDLDIRF